MHWITLINPNFASCAYGNVLKLFQVFASRAYGLIHDRSSLRKLCLQKCSQATTGLRKLCLWENSDKPSFHQLCLLKCHQAGLRKLCLLNNSDQSGHRKLCLLNCHQAIKGFASCAYGIIAIRVEFEICISETTIRLSKGFRKLCLRNNNVLTSPRNCAYGRSTRYPTSSQAAHAG